MLIKADKVIQKIPSNITYTQKYDIPNLLECEEPQLWLGTLLQDKPDIVVLFAPQLESAADTTFNENASKLLGKIVYGHVLIVEMGKDGSLTALDIGTFSRICNIILEE